MGHVGHSMIKLLILLLLCTPKGSVWAQDLKAQLIQIDLGREFGFFSKSPAQLRAVAIESSVTPSKTALLFFPG